MKKSIKTSKKLLYGGITGAVNGFFGAGGGIVCVPMLMNSGFDRKKAHANAVAVILPIALASTVNYLVQGHMKLSDCLVFLPGGIIGSFLGTYLMKKISTKALRRIFGAFMVWAGWRLIF